MPAHCLLATLQCALCSDWAATTKILQKECRSAVKTIVVPEIGIAEWNAALKMCPFGPAPAKIRYMYLGVSVGSAASTSRLACGPWHPSCPGQIPGNTGAAPTKSFQDRAAMITYSMSPQLRLLVLNVYMDSFVVCPSMFALRQ